MRIITWNCLGAFRQKSEHIQKFKPDLALIQECERVEKLVFKAGTQPRVIQWYGDAGAAKGIGIFGYAELSIELATDYYDTSIRHCIPLRVRGLYHFNLIAIWAMPHKGDHQMSYIGQVWRALEKYRGFIRECDTLLAGDFNSNKIFDKVGAEGNHTGVVESLAHEGILSVYHEHFHELPGDETRPTFYLYKDLNKPFHLDYCFAPIDWCRRINHVGVGTLDEWRKWSDHCPLVVEFRDHQDPVRR